MTRYSSSNLCFCLRFNYLILKQKFLEALCITKAVLPEEETKQQTEFSVESVVACLQAVEPFCSSRDDYSSLCLLLTLPRLTEHADYRDWSPSTARVHCFHEASVLVSDFIPADRKLSMAGFCSSPDRLIHLIVKGLLYEASLELCQGQATGEGLLGDGDSLLGVDVLCGSGCDDLDPSLLSWLRSIPPDTFSCTFEQRQLSLHLDRLSRPPTRSVSELLTPIMQKLSPFPSSPLRRHPQSADTCLMSRSLTPALEGFPRGHGGSWVVGPSRSHGDSGASTEEATTMGRGPGSSRSGGSHMSRSFASFHCAGSSGLPQSLIEESPEGPNVVDGTKESECLSHGASHDGEGNISTSVLQSTFKTEEGSEEQFQEYCRQRMRVQQHLEQQEQQRQMYQQMLEEGGVAGDEGTTRHANPGLTQQFLTRSMQKLEEMNISMEGLSPDLPSVEGEVNHGGNFSSLATHSQTRDVTASTGKGDKTVSVSVQQKVSKPAGKMPRPQESPVRFLTSRSSVEGEIVDGHGSGKSVSMQGGTTPDHARSPFSKLASLEDPQAVRAIAFHPSGNLYAVGSNSKALRICQYPETFEFREEVPEPPVLFRRNKHHKGSIYCVAWSPRGDLLATGSNDKCIKVLPFSPDSGNATGPDLEFNMHDGTIRDLAFLERPDSGVPVLISAGAGDCNIYTTDCRDNRGLHALSGHKGHVLALYTWGGWMVASGSQDQTVRFWDLRTPTCVSVIGTSFNGPGSPVASLAVEPSGRLLAAGLEDSSCLLYDIRGGRLVQIYKPHSADVRSLNFSTGAHNLLSASYDHCVALTDLRGDLTKKLPVCIVAKHLDKVIQCRWHPEDMAFLTSSADRTVALWGYRE
uniref:WD repeat domain 47a n=1 Tax=Eptatretus burgeri TaxID=7764 RepID=A0A8C4N3X1_EPTBU